MRARLTLLLLLSLLVACTAPRPQPASATAAVDDIADRFYAWTLETVPEQAYFAGIHVERHDGLQDISPSALTRRQPARSESTDCPRWHPPDAERRDHSLNEALAPRGDSFLPYPVHRGASVDDVRTDV